MTATAAVTASFGLPGGALIAGAWQTGGLTFAVADPHDGTPVGWVARNDAADVDAAVRAVARAAAEPWPLWLMGTGSAAKLVTCFYKFVVLLDFVKYFRKTFKPLLLHFQSQSRTGPNTA